MSNQPIPPTPETDQQPAGKGLDGAPCSALEFLAQELDMPAEHIREAARAMQIQKLVEAADKLHQAFYVMKHDWQNGDFELPRLAEIHIAAIESKAIDLGKILFRMQNKEL